MEVGSGGGDTIGGGRVGGDHVVATTNEDDADGDEKANWNLKVMLVGFEGS